MIDGKAFSPWEQLDPAMKAAAEQAIEHYGIELHDWQRTVLACMLTDPPETIYVLTTPGRARDHKLAMQLATKARKLLESEDR